MQNLKIEELSKKNKNLEHLLKIFDKRIISSTSDLHGNITSVSQAYADIAGYSVDELIGKSYSMLKHPDMPVALFEELWMTIKAGKVWRGEVKNLKKDGSFYWVEAIIEPEFNNLGDTIGYTEISTNITAQKETEELNLLSTIINESSDLIFYKDYLNYDGTYISCNTAFLEFVNKSTDQVVGKDDIEIFGEEVGIFFRSKDKEVFDSKKIITNEEWVTYPDGRKVFLTTTKTPFYSENGKAIGIVGVSHDITEIEHAKQEIEAIHKHTKDSIEYASHIQGAIVSQHKDMQPFFKDSFVHWIPKDTVGGDIWLFNELRHEDECLLFFIDCTGHGVPGAFVTMIVKSIEREIVSKIKADRYYDIDVSPAWLMAYFNKTMKSLLKQETKDSLSNAGWDGGIIYYNKRKQVLKFAGAETPLFYIDENKKLITVKGNRYSVGYKKCDADYVYSETIIDVKEGMKFYCTTDGFLDQNGGEKGFPFGKKRFTNIIKENHANPMMSQKDVFIDMIEAYEKIMEENNDRNDDITLLAFEIDTSSNFTEEIVEEIVKYEGVMTQNVIAATMDNIELKVTSIGMLGIISTITIEYCQNMMHYSKNKEVGSRKIVPAGQIEVQYINEEYYNIFATNIVSIEDKEKIEKTLREIKKLDKAGIKKRYRELRKSGENSHKKGGGIGMYEIAKTSDELGYDFQIINEFHAINEDKFYFTMKSVVKPKT